MGLGGFLNRVAVVTMRVKLLIYIWLSTVTSSMPVIARAYYAFIRCYASGGAIDRAGGVLRSVCSYLMNRKASWNAEIKWSGE